MAFKRFAAKAVVSSQDADGAVGWVIDDNGRSRADAIAMLGDLGIRAVGLATKADFEAAVQDVSSAKSAPDVIVLDLRLPWEDEAILVENALAGGVACLERLKASGATRQTPVIVFSAFVDDELVRAQLRPYAPAAIIDKAASDRLPLVVDNVLPNRPPPPRDVMKRVVAKGEHQVLRAGALIGAVTGIVTLVALVLRWLF